MSDIVYKGEVISPFQIRYDKKVKKYKLKSIFETKSKKVFDSYVLDLKIKR